MIVSSAMMYLMMRRSHAAGIAEPVYDHRRRAQSKRRARRAIGVAAEVNEDVDLIRHDPPGRLLVSPAADIPPVVDRWPDPSLQGVGSA